MQLIKVKDKNEACELLAMQIINQVRTKPTSVLGLATGSSVIKTYQSLVADAKLNHTDYSKVRTFNLDEYADLEPNSENSYLHFMKVHLFNHIKFYRNHMPYQFATSYRKLLSKHPRDLQILGVGVNGHIGFNEPMTKIDSITRIVCLDEVTIKRNKELFPMDENPELAITMGIKEILDAKKIVLIAFGKDKAQAMKALLSNDEIDPQWPCTYLKTHKNTIIIADSDALSLLEGGTTWQ